MNTYSGTSRTQTVRFSCSADTALFVQIYRHSTDHSFNYIESDNWVNNKNQLYLKCVTSSHPSGNTSK